MTELLFMFGILFASMMSPGPDMMLIMRYALSSQPRTVFFCIIGVCAGLCLHIALALLGLTALIASGGGAYTLAKLLGAFYLIYIGYRIFTSAPDMGRARTDNTKDNWQALQRGFLTNILNPKVMIFILAVFTQIIGPGTAVAEKAVLISAFLLAVFVIWSGFALLIRQPFILKGLKKHEGRMNRIFGILLIGFGLTLGVTS